MKPALIFSLGVTLIFMGSLVLGSTGAASILIGSSFVIIGGKSMSLTKK